MFKGSTLKLAATVAVIAVIAGAALSAGPAFAAKGGKPGSGGSTTTSATCAVSPNPVAAGAQFVISGSKYAPGQYLTLAITSGGGTSYVWTQADANGNLSKTWQLNTVGSNSVRVHNSVTGSLLASCGFSTY